MVLVAHKRPSLRPSSEAALGGERPVGWEDGSLSVTLGLSSAPAVPALVLLKR